MQEGSTKAIVAAFFANLGITVATFVGFRITRSAGLLAGSGHSLADPGNQALLLFGSRRGQRPADHVKTKPKGWWWFIRNSLIHVQAMHLGPDDLLVAAKIDFQPDLSLADLARAIDAAEVAICAAVPMDLTIYIEPGVRRNAAE